MYCHALATKNEPSLVERERAMGFQTGTISHTKVTRLECNASNERHGPEIPYMVVGNQCTLSNVHNISIDSINLQFWQCDYMALQPSTLAYLQHSTLHF